jgi:hypothetical protein
MLEAMPVCPFCQTDLPMPSLPCRNCGRRMADHPSLAEGKSYSVKPDAPDAPVTRVTRGARAPARPVAAASLSPDLALSPQDVPELQLATRHAPKPPKPAVSSPSGPSSDGRAQPGTASKAPSLPPPLPKKPKPPGARAPVTAIPGVGGAVFDDDDVFAPAGGGAPLELDTGTPPTSAPNQVAPLSAPVRASSLAPREGPQKELALPAERALQTGPSHELIAGDSEAASLADYGDPPASWWQAPLYAYRVKMRQSELRRHLAERKSDLARARQVEEEAKLAFADRARAVAKNVEAYARPLAAIDTAERLMMDRDGVLSAEMEAHKGRLAVIDERVVGLGAELAEARAEERKLEESLAEAEAIRQRAEAKLKRAEIEIRNASSLVDQAAAAQRDSAKRAGLP